VRSGDEGLDQLPITHYQLPNRKIKILAVWRSAQSSLGPTGVCKSMKTFYRAVDSSDRSFEIIKTGWLLFVVSGDL